MSARARKRGHTAPRRPQPSALLTGDYDALSVEERCDAIFATRVLAVQQVADERAQDARLGRAVYRAPDAIADARVAALPEDDPRRLAYLRALLEERAR